MRRFHLFAGALALAFAVAAVGGAAARSQANTFRIGAAMVAANETPSPKGDVSAAKGTFTATVTKTGTGAELSWRLEFSSLTGNAIAAHIHVAARGVSGPVRVPLCAPCTSGVTGTATITADVLDAILNDRAYVNVHTPTNPAGEIRDQVSVVASVKTALRAAQERPKPKGKLAKAKGTFTATVSRSGSTGVITWRLTFSKLSGRAMAAHIHSGARGKAGPVIVPLCAPCRSGAHGRATVNASVLNALESGRTYVNVHTTKNPAGEIRGQLAAVPLS
ncbi:MAG: CHRD domain-containing protein [Gaiellaceae bacterium]